MIIRLLRWQGVRDWPFGSALSFIMMAVMLAATLVYFRVSAEAEKAEANR